jgi:excisionase family DNA binding protein
MSDLTSYRDQLIVSPRSDTLIFGGHSVLSRLGLLDQEEVGKVFGVTKRTVQRWTRDRLIPYLKVGRTVRYDLEEIRSVVNGGQDRHQKVNEPRVGS